MATTLKFPTSTNAVQKTLDAALLAGVTAAVTLNSVVGIQNKAGVFVVDRVDSNGTATPSKREYIIFTGVSGSTLTTLIRNADGGGTDQDHAVGAVVEFVSDVLQEQAILDALLLVVTTAGVLNRATGATINTGTDDDKIVTPKAIADSDISTGWTSARETWTYASASTINVPAGATAKYSVGDKLKFTQHGVVKYAVVIVVADTLLTIAINTDFVVENTATYAITLNYYSHQDTPIGFPSHFNFVPVFLVTSIDNGSGGQPTLTYATYSISGCKFKFMVMGTGTKVGTNAYIAFAYANLPAFKGKPGSSVIGIGGGALNDLSWVSHELTYIYTSQLASATIADNATCLFRIFGEWPI